MQTISDASLNNLTADLAAMLLSKQIKLVSAESCTGGWLAKCCTDLAGSSRWFERGFITYSNDAKQLQLAVSHDSLAYYGAVSQQVAEEMALGALHYSLADISVAITGIAGPDGGSVDKPVGTVWIAWATKNAKVSSQRFQFDGDRDAVRRQAVFSAMTGIIKNARDS